MKAVHFLNQFFAGIGGEKAAKQPPLRLDGAVGPGRQLDVEISATVVCGDDYFGENESEALGQLLQWIEECEAGCRSSAVRRSPRAVTVTPAASWLARW